MWGAVGDREEKKGEGWSTETDYQVKPEGVRGEDLLFTLETGQGWAGGQRGDGQASTWNGMKWYEVEWTHKNNFSSHRQTCTQVTCGGDRAKTDGLSSQNNLPIVRL